MLRKEEKLKFFKSSFIHLSIFLVWFEASNIHLLLFTSPGLEALFSFKLFLSSILFSTSLTTPTASVDFISRTAKRPNGAYCEKASTHIGLEGTILTIAESH